ncbi:uncharacterized protein MKK02DRAFT_40597 [Dioszegia hungarica]|uniref:Uncharacterized protein n=1 Tax=Dioszegia hungarica TaxID=4972 RepID=A0AA38LS72_9TREE|nr:uncharacterized protein MKK02DRAFT_40597 [Dioszegia hungarica]KAI9632294.1 hypothetical protein MKK02DRAFT_40597 [Dioszegia hungarica]
MAISDSQDIEAVRSEWETCEDLLAQSQKDNEEKYKIIERYKQYTKELEKLIECSCGAAWRDDHGIPPFSTAIPATSASTPLPKPQPSMLRHSTSITQSTKRSTRLVGRIASQQIDPRHLDSLREVSETLTDSTPTDAMRRLQGKDTPARPGSLLDKQITAQSTRERDAIRLLLDEMDRNLDRRESAISRLRQEAFTERSAVSGER